MSDKSNAVTDDEFVEADELLASIPVEAEAMDLAEADGFMTAVQLLPKTPETKDWLPHILSTIGAKDAGTGSAASDKRLRALLLKRFHQIGDQLTQAVPLDPVYFEAEDEKGRPLTGKAAIEALEPFALGFLEAAQTWPGILDTNSRAVARSLHGVLRHLPEEALGDFAQVKTCLLYTSPSPRD